MCQTVQMLRPPAFAHGDCRTTGPSFPWPAEPASSRAPKGVPFGSNAAGRWRLAYLALVLALAPASVARADNAVSEEVTYGPASINKGYFYVGNDVSAEIDLVPPRWSLLANYLLATDAFEALHNTFELGPVWRLTPRLELGAYLRYSPLATGTALAQIPPKTPGQSAVTEADHISSDDYGGGLTANYQLGDERRTLTFIGEVAYTYFDIDQKVTAPIAKTESFTAELQQWVVTAGIAGRYHWTRLSLQGSYYAYDHDPADVGKIYVQGLGTNAFQIGGLSAAAAGLPSAPLQWSAAGTLRQQLGQHFAAYLSYAYQEYVSPDGNGQVITPKFAWQISGMWRVYAAYTFQRDSQALFPNGQGEPPQDLSLFTLGVNLSL